MTVTFQGTDIGKDKGSLIMAKRQDIQSQVQRQPVIPPRPQRQRRRFNSSLVLVPLSLLFAAWVLNRIKPAIGVSDIVNVLGIRNRERASMLIVLALTLLAILAIVRILRRSRR